MGACQHCGRGGLAGGMTMCDDCLRSLGTRMQELEDQGVDTLNPDDPNNPFAPPRQTPANSGGCAVAAVALLSIPAAVTASVLHLMG